MKDIVPELYEDIRKDFNHHIALNPYIKAFRKRLEEETATGDDVSQYARQLGECASKTLLENLTEEKLPDGILYWNIVFRTVLPLLKEIHIMVNNAGIEVLSIEDSKTGIGLKPVRAPFPEERAEALLNRLSDITMKDDNEQI